VYEGPPSEEIYSKSTIYTFLLIVIVIVTTYYLPFARHYRVWTLKIATFAYSVMIHRPYRRNAQQYQCNLYAAKK